MDLLDSSHPSEELYGDTLTPGQIICNISYWLFFLNDENPFLIGLEEFLGYDYIMVWIVASLTKFRFGCGKQAMKKDGLFKLKIFKVQDADMLFKAQDAGRDRSVSS